MACLPGFSIYPIETPHLIILQIRIGLI